jgi:hypothetical protein
MIYAGGQSTAWGTLALCTCHVLVIAARHGLMGEVSYMAAMAALRSCALCGTGVLWGYPPCLCTCMHARQILLMQGPAGVPRWPGTNTGFAPCILCPPVGSLAAVSRLWGVA